MVRRPLLAATLLAAAPACRENPAALRNVGEDCASCHREGGKAPESKFTASGSVFRSPADPPAAAGAGGIRVILTDPDGRTVELTSNSAGNFYTERRLDSPLAAELRDAEGKVLGASPPGACAQGSCNACHQPRGAGGARGRLLAP